MRPLGWFMGVTSAVVRNPSRLPVSTSERANKRAWSRVFMNAPEPYFTSNTSAVRLSASFLLRMLAVISGIELTVAVTSRKAYSRRSAGTSVAVAPVITQPTLSTTERISSVERSVRTPGMDSSLSSVPPVAPRPRPEIIGTFNPQQANSGATMNELLSPMPPVECLSTRTPEPSLLRTSPERSMASVRAKVSSTFRPRKYTAMVQADIW